jgi:putative hydrolase of the HAD superfamily
MDIAQATADQIIYIEDTPLFVDVAGGLGIQGILHQNYASTARALNAMGLKTESP